MRVRLRPAHSLGALGVLYRVPHDHTRWPDHVARVQQTIAAGKTFTGEREWPRWRIADLSCGDAAIPRGLARPDDVLILGDMAPGYYEITGPIEQTIERLASVVDLFVCCETVEHLDDPDAVLAAVRARAYRLLLSTPLGETAADNPEHYWGWDDAGVADMLAGAGWTPAMYETIDHPLARYQLWGCV